MGIEQHKRLSSAYRDEEISQEGPEDLLEGPPLRRGQGHCQSSQMAQEQIVDSVQSVGVFEAFSCQQ